MALHSVNTDLPGAFSMVSRVETDVCRSGFRRWFGGLFALYGLLVLEGWTLHAAEVDYDRDVKPLLQQHCTRCHGAKRQRGDLRLDSRGATLKGGGVGRR